MTSSASTATTRQAPTADLARQAAVVLGAVAALLGLAIGVGAFGGTPVAEAAGGALSAESTLVAPAGPAFSIWTPIYAGLALLALWQLAPARRTDERQRRVGWWVAASGVANVAWILAVQAGSVVLSVVVIVVLLGTLVVAFGRLVASRPSSRLEAVVLDGTIGLYLGWVSVATVANTAAALVDAGVDGLGLGETTWALVVLAVVTAVGVGVAVVGRGRLAYAASLVWGLSWISVARASGPDDASAVVVAAAVAAVVVTVATVAIRARSDRRDGSAAPSSSATPA